VINPFTGALHSLSGINQWLGGITLGSANASIGVEPDPNASNTQLYFTNDYSLTVTNNPITGSSLQNPAKPFNPATNQFTTFHKQDAGQLILPIANTYLGNTIIEQGWVTVQNNNSLGGTIGGQGDTVQPGTIVRTGAALHLRPLTPTSPPFNLLENLVLAGNGITHPFGLINQKGALMSLGGLNALGGIVNNRSSDIQLSGNAGIGVESLVPEVQTVTVPAGLAFNLTVANPFSSFAPQTASLPASATALQVQNALNALPTVGGSAGAVTVARTGVGPFTYTVTFSGFPAPLDLPLMTTTTAGVTITPVVDGGWHQHQRVDQHQFDLRLQHRHLERHRGWPAPLNRDHHDRWSA